jgi:predicted Zn finger-like uncharacterized protein
MSLATRCTACGTVFRVVQDQLKVSEGWVRCGRCNEVFNALEGLFDLEGSSGPTPLSRESGLQPLTAGTRPEPGAPGDGQPAAARADMAQEAAAQDADDTQIDTRADSQTRSDTEADDPLTGHPPRPAGGHEIDSVAGDASDSALSGQDEMAEPTPSFLRAAQRRAQWERPRVRRSLAVLALILAGVLAVQVVLHQRDTLAARRPATAPYLASLCELMGCSLRAPRTIEALAVESSGLNRVEGTPLYRLQVVLRNRGQWPVLAPALDLTLTDTRGDVITRRVLRGADLGAAAGSPLAAGGDWSINAVLDLGDARVAGYTIELFYP